MRHSQQYGMTDVVWMCGKENDRVYTMLSRKAHLENGHVLQCEVPRRYFLGLCSRRVEHCDCHHEVWLLSPVNTCVFCLHVSKVPSCAYC